MTAPTKSPTREVSRGRAPGVRVYRRGLKHLRELERRVDADDADERGIVLGSHPAGGGGNVPAADELAAEVEQFLREQNGDE
jgi:hypothetical protein